MAEAFLFSREKDNAVRCNACRHHCVLKPDQRGICGVRQNINGVLHLLTHGFAIADAVDPIEKKPLYHFLPISNIYSIATLGCNMKCEFCQNADISQGAKGGGEIVGFPLTTEQIIEKTFKNNCPGIAYTYTEPSVFFEYAYDTMVTAKKYNLKNVFVSNGYFTEELLEKADGLLDAINIDLKSCSPDFYKKICGAELKYVLENIQLVAKRNIWMELTTLVIPGHNDSDEELEKIATFIASVNPLIPWHVSRFFPGYKMMDTAPTPLKTLQKVYNIGKKAGLKFIYVGNAPQLDLANTHCHACNTLLIKRQNYFVTYVHFRDGKCLNCGTMLPGVFS